ELAREQMSPEQRAERDRLYALNPDEVGDSGPSVVTINGVVASLACTEALMSSRSAVFLVFKARLHCGAVAEATRTGDVDVFLVFKARLHCGGTMAYAGSGNLLSSWSSRPGSIAAGQHLGTRFLGCRGLPGLQGQAPLRHGPMTPDAHSLKQVFLVFKARLHCGPNAPGLS